MNGGIRLYHHGTSLDTNGTCRFAEHLARLQILEPGLPGVFSEI